MYGWIDVWMDRWIDVWMDRYVWVVWKSVGMPFDPRKHGHSL